MGDVLEANTTADTAEKYTAIFFERVLKAEHIYMSAYIVHVHIIKCTLIEEMSSF